ncbi:hypothetical protein [Nostoc sp. CENA543]|uniref:hypothetical protein n=1 Tax=Nostoc sp. CENA543 TaxID=1869241 RepID=UPI001CEF7B2C|nr:hypothetical protein [Nostoc sp. CENA543]
MARQEDGRLILEKPENIRQRLKTRFAHIQKSISLTDELIAERRRNAPPHILD